VETTQLSKILFIVAVTLTFDPKTNIALWNRKNAIYFGVKGQGHHYYK
jgi:hypothetical protein